LVAGDLSKTGRKLEWQCRRGEAYCDSEVGKNNKHDWSGGREGNVPV